jgi:hypothetical protein
MTGAILEQAETGGESAVTLKDFVALETRQWQKIYEYLKSCA